MTERLRVAQLPVNTASLPLHTARALRETGIDARAWEFAMEPSPYTADADVAFVQLPRSYRSVAGATALIRFLQLVRWADVLHWYSGTRILRADLDLRVVAAKNPARLIEWTGSEIRDPLLEARDNPVFAAEIESGALKSVWSAERAQATQKVFADAGFIPVCATGMVQYVLPEYRETLQVIERAIDPREYEPAYPSPDSEVVVIAHAPSALAIKGTRYLIAAAEELEQKTNTIFNYIVGLSRAEALREMRACDIFVDQLILGDFGMAALEAMALGKPVVAYVKPSLQERYPQELPIVSATPDMLGEVLAGLVADPVRRYELGQQGRRFVEAHADIRDRAARLSGLYRQIATG